MVQANDGVCRRHCAVGRGPAPGADRGERARVLDGIEKQLTHEPLRETTNRKPLRPNPIAPWELRLGSLRVFYDVAERQRTVLVLAIGKKVRNVLRIGGQEIRL